MNNKVIATILTAIMALSPIVMAYDLGDYPGFLFKDHNLAAYVVVGADAKPSDVVGAVDLAVRLAGESYEEVSTGAGTTVTGGETEKINLGGDLTDDFKTSLDDDDIAGLQDTTITWDDGTGSDTYEVHDEIVLGADSPSVETSLSSGEDDYGSGVYIEVTRGSICYYYVFEESINLTRVSEDYPLEINFLGNSLTITDVDGDNKITAQVGKKVFLNVGDSVEVEGKTVTLENVGSTDSVVVTVDGSTDTITSGSTKTIGGLQVKNYEAFYTTEKEDRSATLIVGEYAVKSYQNNDRYIGEPKVGYNWRWVLDDLDVATTKGDTSAGSGGPTMGVCNYFRKLSKDHEPITVGGEYAFPNDFVKIQFDGLTVPDTDYVTVTVEFDDTIDVDDADAQGQTWGPTEHGFTIVADVPESIMLDEDGSAWSSEYLTGDTATDTVYLVVADSDTDYVDVFYLDENRNPVFAGNITGLNAAIADFAYIDYKDTTGTGDIQLGVNGYINGTNTFKLVFQDENTNVPGDGDISIWLYQSSNEFASLGDTADTAEGDELLWGSTNIGEKNEDLRTNYGIIIKDPKTNGADDRVVFEIPGDAVEAEVSIVGTGSTVTPGGETVKKVVPITSAVAKLDTEISLPVKKNLVLVGGPAVNRLTAQAMGYSYPTYGADITEFGEGEGYIKVYEDVLEEGYVAVVVAGWEAEDTRNACSVLQQYESFEDQLDGNVAVKVTSVTAGGITAAA